MFKFPQTIFLFIAASISLLAIADTAVTANPAAPAPAQVQPTTTTTTVPTQNYCPEPNQLVKKDLYWSAEGGWISYGESFDKEITGFVKAEWVGLNVGRIICIYQGDRKYSFQIVLEQKHHKSIPVPSGHNWRVEKAGRKDCIANNVKDCPFIIEGSKKSEDIYQGLDFFKGKPNE